MKLVCWLSPALVFGLVAVWVVGQEWRGQLVGLPPLPPEFVEDSDENGPPPPKQESQRETMLRQAFGAGSEEMSRPIRLLVRDKGMVVSAGQFSIEVDGRVKFAPFSAAIFPKHKDGGYPEINTFQCDFAFLALDKPVQMPWELVNRELTAVELRGGGGRGVKIINNRRTPEENDDLEVIVTQAPLFYEARRNLIWSDGYVKLCDFQSQPKPTVVIGRGMEMHLAPDSGPNKPNVEDIGKVELLILRSNVSMYFYLDSYEGFLDGNDAAPAPKMPGGAQVRIVQAEGHRSRHNDLAGVRAEPTKNPPDKISPEKFRISTNGTFTYDATKGLAWFDSAPRSKDGTPPMQVLVSRDDPTEPYDQILCDHLKLQFRKNTRPSAKPAATETQKKPAKKAEPKDEKNPSPRPGLVSQWIPRRRSFAGSTSRHVVHQPVSTVCTNSSGSCSWRIPAARRSWS